MMFAKFFKAAELRSSESDWSSFTEDFLLATDRILSYDYTKRFTKVGSFTMVLPFDKTVLRRLKLNGTIYYDKDWLWIQSIEYNGETITLSGTDCKGFLDTRISLYNTGQQQAQGTQGYDAVAGTTAECLEHYLLNNCIKQYCSSGRELPLISQISGTSGLSNDNYMSSLELLSEIFANMCENAEIGYDIKGVLRDKCFQVQLLSGIDRSHIQAERPRVIFSSRHRNIRSQNYVHGVEDLFNAIYATDSNNYTSLVFRDGEGVSQLNRRECNVSVGIANTDSYFEKYALRETADNLETHSFTVEAAVSSGYDEKYELGDYVSLLDDFTNNLQRVQITEATKSYASGQQSLSLVFGTPKQKPLQKIVNSFISGTAKRR